MSARPAVFRILRIHQLIQARRHPNISELARLLDVSKRTVQRDIDNLRDQLGAPLAFNPIENGFEYTDERFSLPEMDLAEGEILTLLVTEPALATYRGTEYEELLRDLLRKAEETLRLKRGLSPQKIAEAYSFQPEAQPSRVDAKIWSAIERAIRSRETLEIVYHPQKRADSPRRRIDPYHLALVDGEWYLLAHCHREDEEQVFRPAHVRKVKRTGRHYLPRPFDPEGFLRSRIDEIAAKRVFEAVLRFEPGLAAHLLQRDLGSGYRVQTLMNGGVEISFRSDNPDAVVRWCLGWGPGAEVVRPAWVRRRARQILRQLTKRYTGAARSVRATGSRPTKKAQRPPA